MYAHLMTDSQRALRDELRDLVRWAQGWNRLSLRPILCALRD